MNIQTRGPIDSTMSLEDFLLMRLKMATADFEENHPLLIENAVIGFTIVIQCLQFVKISAQYDELAEALKKAVKMLNQKNPQLAGFNMIFGLTVLNKLESEKNGEPLDGEYCSKLDPDNAFTAEEIRRVWG